MLTLLVPTMNRPEFVIRLLQYYKNSKFRHSILIGDSSNGEEFEKTKRAVEVMKDDLKVEHYHYPGINNYSVTKLLLNKVSTPYASYLADDDFLVPASLEKCLEFMERHQDYSCAWGKTVAFNLEQSGAYGDFANTFNSNSATNHSIEHDSAIERLSSHIRNYSAVFVGVCRTPLFVKALRYALELEKTASFKDMDLRWWTAESFGELATSFSLVAQGKVKAIDCLYWIRQMHNNRYLFPDTFDWLTSLNWFACYNIISNQIIQDIIEKEGASLEEAKGTWKKLFWAYLSNGISPKHEQRGNKKSYGQNIKMYMKKHYYPLWQILKEKRDSFFPSNRLSLPVLLNKRSVYDGDLAPIYRLITGYNSI